jgi:hypothetical protein
VETPRIVAAVGTSQGQSAMLGVGDTRVNLSVPHLLSAAFFSRRLGKLESENAGKQFGAFWDEIFAQSSAVVFAAVAALEAYANEMFIDHREVFPELRDEVMAKLWELYEQKPPLEKYEFALLLKQSTQLDKSSSPYQDVAALIRLRNALTHFKPEWFSEQVEHARLSATLVHRAKLSPFFPATEPLFPRGWASHDTAVWAIKSVVSFILKFEQDVRIRPRMEKFKDQFNEL